MKKVIDFLKENLDKNASIVVACSGGPDSMCLLDLVTKLKDELNLNIIVAHVNHKLRSESEEEAKMVENYAKENNITFELLEITDYINGNFTEEDARKRRYNFFNEIIKKYQASALLTAHHGDDLIETILMRLTRGSNLSGYIGIKEISQTDNYKTLRPLLTITKDEIVNYLKENNVPYRLDKTNEELKHTRNRYRHIVLPFLKKENPKVHEKYLKFSKELIEYDNFVNTYIKDKKFIVDNSIVINKVSSEIDFIKRKRGSFMNYKELAEKYGQDVLTMVGFLDGINDSLKIPNPIETMDENTKVSLCFDKELLYKNMVDARADWLYELPQWDAIFTPEKRKELYLEQKKSGTVVKAKKIGRNDPCPCGSGKKYKYCCGKNA